MKAVDSVLISVLETYVIMIFPVLRLFVLSVLCSPIVKGSLMYKIAVNPYYSPTRRLFQDVYTDTHNFKYDLRSDLEVLGFSFLPSSLANSGAVYKRKCLNYGHFLRNIDLLLRIIENYI